MRYTLLIANYIFIIETLFDTVSICPIVYLSVIQNNPIIDKIVNSFVLNTDNLYIY